MRYHIYIIIYDDLIKLGIEAQTGEYASPTKMGRELAKTGFHRPTLLILTTESL